MAQATVEDLFINWRKGDAGAGQTMAQTFSDWFYAVSVSRLGDRHGRAPLERACKNFLEGIPTVGDPKDLGRWAHNLVLQEIESAGTRIKGGDFPNALTQNRYPTALLRQAQGALEDGDLRLLAMAYGATASPEELIEAAEARGGMPYGILIARYRLKKWLRDQAQVGFAVVRDQPPLDFGPLPLYEAALLASDAEELAFERWELMDTELCKDVAEFATFALALRGGALVAALGPRKAAAATPAAAAAPAAEEPDSFDDLRDEGQARGGAGKIVLVLVGLGAIGLLVAVAVAAVLMLAK